MSIYQRQYGKPQYLNGNSSQYWEKSHKYLNIEYLKASTCPLRKLGHAHPDQSRGRELPLKFHPENHRHHYPGNHPHHPHHNHPENHQLHHPGNRHPHHRHRHRHRHHQHHHLLHLCHHYHHHNCYHHHHHHHETIV